MSTGLAAGHRRFGHVATRYLLVAASAFVLFLTACGGDGAEPLTRDEYAESADEICTELDEESEAIASPTSPDRVDEYVDELIPAYEDALERLKQLEPPEETQETVDEWIGLGDETLARLNEVRDAAGEGDEAEVRRILAEVAATNGRVNEVARELGADACASE